MEIWNKTIVQVVLVLLGQLFSALAAHKKTTEIVSTETILKAKVPWDFQFS